MWNYMLLISVHRLINPIDYRGSPAPNLISIVLAVNTLNIILLAAFYRAIYWLYPVVEN
jgi:hypothetical protein